MTSFTYFSVYLFISMVVAGVLYGFWDSLKSRSGTSATEDDEVVFTEDDLEYFRKERHEYVLSHINHKKLKRNEDLDEEMGGYDKTDSLEFEENKCDNDETSLQNDTLVRSLSSWRSSNTKDSTISSKTCDSERSVEIQLYTESVCPICLDEYEDGDEICWSHSKACHHAFHLDCMAGWLQKHEDCPLCREKYLVPMSSEKPPNSQ